MYHINHDGNLDVVMLMYSLIEYSPNYSDINNSNYSGTTGSLCFCSIDKATDFTKNIANNNVFKFFEYKAKISETKLPMLIMEF